MWAMRTESELILKSRWVLPGVLTAAEFRFRHVDLTEALADVHRHRAARPDGASDTSPRGGIHVV